MLAFSSLITDSITFDETAHLTAGMSYLKTGDFRLSPEHPPLSKLWAALPLLFVQETWLSPDDPVWQQGDLFNVGRAWLFGLNNGQQLMVIGRCMMLILLLGTCLTTYALGRTLFGPTAGLLALFLAVLGPELLAHGRLVTTDQPITLCTALTLLTFARLMQRLSWPRLLAAALALTAASLVKLSWPLILPALAVMTVMAILRRQPIELATGVIANGAASAPRLLTRRRERILAALGTALFTSLVLYCGIWACYGFRRNMLVQPETGPTTQPTQIERKIARDWQNALHLPDGSERRGFLPTFLKTAAESSWLPDAYVVGLAMSLQYSGPRMSYLLGECNTTGWLMYFPIAFAIKTPVATMLLLLGGLAALVLRRVRSRDHVLLVGLLVFAAVQTGFLMSSRMNIGVRHLLPVYPVVYVLAGAAAAWLTQRAGRWLLGAALLWLVGANVSIYPQYLAYFNELVGGPSHGYLCLADSNLDWGQDLLRLADYENRHPAERIKLAYFGSAVPNRYVNCTALPSYLPFTPLAEFGEGTYVVSVTQLLGVYDTQIRSSFWTQRVRDLLRDFTRVAAEPPAENESDEIRARRAQMLHESQDLRGKLLLTALRDRPPDERVGYSLFVYRLSGPEVEALTRP